MNGPPHASGRRSGPLRPVRGSLAPDEREFPLVNQPCYAFNHRLKANSNDRRCEHCAHYLTSRCRHLEEFLEDVDDLSPE